MTGFSIAAVWIALAAQVLAWPEAKLHQASDSLMRLPPNDRVIAERLLRSQLGPLTQGEDAGQMNKAIEAFRVERLSVAGAPTLAVQAAGDDFCGAADNCTFWIIDLRHHRILLRADGIQEFGVERNSKSGPADIITRTHESAFEGELIRWQFAGATYQPADCATVDTSDPDGNLLPQPKITRHSCTPEGN